MFFSKKCFIFILLILNVFAKPPSHRRYRRSNSDKDEKININPTSTTTKTTPQVAKIPNNENVTSVVESKKDAEKDVDNEDGNESDENESDENDAEEEVVEVEESEEEEDDKELEETPQSRKSSNSTSSTQALNKQRKTLRVPNKKQKSISKKQSTKNQPSSNSRPKHSKKKASKLEVSEKYRKPKSFIQQSRVNVELIPSGMQITDVENRFTCLITLNNERICKQLTSFIVLNKNKFDCRERHIEIAFQGYNTDLVQNEDYIESFLNRGQGEVMSAQEVGKECLYFKK